jgi:hypothetical protein
VNNTSKSADPMESKKPTSPEEGSNGTQPIAPADTESVKADEINGARKSTLTKREIMEQLSRDRFPWEE